MNNWLDGRSSLHLVPDGQRHTALLTGGEDPELATPGCVVAAVSGIGQSMA